MKVHENVTRDNLNDVMEFDHVIRVHDDGTVSDVDMYAPECYDTEVFGDWTLLDGYSSQYGYSGPCMHASESIGGSMAGDILSTPGIYVALVDTTLDAGEDDDNVIGWVVARKND